MELNTTHFNLLRLLEQKSNINQRAIATELQISLGKANYCLNTLIKKGYIKTIKTDKNKFLYIYKLTSKGLQTKAKLTVQFLKRKMAEYDKLQAEIEELNQEVQRLSELGMLRSNC
jgi:EPS-associated MarR family transcriptional regulator